MSRIVIDVSSEEHQKIKTLAALQGKSIKDYVLGKVFSGSTDEENAMSSLKALLSQRIENAEKQGGTGKTFSQIADETIKK